MDSYKITNAIIDEILHIVNFNSAEQNSRTLKQDFRQNKRPSSSEFEIGSKSKILRSSCKCEDKVMRLEEELFLLSETLKFVTEEKDRLKTIAETSRGEAESLAYENHKLTLSNSEMTSLVQEQSKECLDMMSMMMELLWSVTSSATSHVQFSNFLNFVTKLLSQLTGEMDSVKETKIICSVLGCLVNFSSSKETLSLLTRVEKFPLLVDKLAVMLSSNFDQKVLLLTMMFFQNILSADFIFQESNGFLKESTFESLVKVVGGVMKSGNPKSRLHQVAQALNDSLQNGEREQ